MEYPHYSLPTVDLEKKIFVPKMFRTKSSEYYEKHQEYRQLAQRYNAQKGFLSQTEIKRIVAYQKNPNLTNPLSPDEMTEMMDFYKEWMTPVPFKDVTGKQLSIGDVIYRIDYNKLVLTVISRMTESGALIFLECFYPTYGWNHKKGEPTTYDYSEDGIPVKSVQKIEGNSSGYDSAKYIKVEKNLLSEFQKKLIKDKLNIKI